MTYSAEHLLACIIESAVYDAGEAESVCVSIVRETRSNTVRAQLIAQSITGAPASSLQGAVQSLYDVMVERAHKDRVRAAGLLSRLDASAQTGSKAE